jgi:hypothetical protein
MLTDAGGCLRLSARCSCRGCVQGAVRVRVRVRVCAREGGGRGDDFSLLEINGIPGSSRL